MSVAKLNVEIGAQISGLQKALRQSERDLKAFGRNMASLGNQLSLALTLPLGAIGVSAIKAAGEMEALRLAMRATFEGAGRSIQEADKELEALRKSALAPGLDFEQAVRGSVRLQNVGYTAEKARGIIEQLANTVATTGGTADDLNEVVNQFSQMIGKGKLFQDDLKIITGRMPKVAQLMKEAFGTTTAEGLNKLGVDARTFVDTILKKMEDMPRVTGGVANSIVNAWSSVKQSLATLGESLNKTFNVGGRLDQFAAWIEGLANGFAGLSDGAQTAILGIGVFVAALGPAIRAGGLLVQSVYAIGNAFTALKIEALKGQVLGLVGWWKQLNIVMKANIIGVTIGVVVALAAAFAALSENTNIAAEISKTAAQNIASEKSKVDLLLPTLKSEVASREQKAAAMAELQKISPQYFGQLDSEKSKVVDITKAYDAYIANLLRSAKAAAAREKLVEIEKQLLEIDQRRGNFSQGEKQALGMIGVTTDMNVALEKQKAVLDAQAAPLEAQKRALAGIVTENEMVAQTTKKITDNLGDNTKKVKESETEYDGAIRRVGMWAQSLLRLQSVQEAGRLGKPLEKLPQAGGGGLGPVESLNAGNEQLAKTQSILTSLAIGAQEATKPISIMAQAIQAAGTAMSEAAASGEASFGKLALAAVGAAAKIVKAWIMQGVAAAAAKALSFLPFPFNIAGAAAAGGLAGALFNKLLGALKIPAFAEGTRNAPGGLSLVGERGPELVNLRAGSQVIPNHALRGAIGGGSQQLYGQFTLSRGDLILAVKSAAAEHFRTTGQNPFNVR